MSKKVRKYTCAMSKLISISKLYNIFNFIVMLLFNNKEKHIKRCKCGLVTKWLLCFEFEFYNKNKHNKNVMLLCYVFIIEDSKSTRIKYML